MRHGKATWIWLMAAWLLAACGSYVRPGDGSAPRPDATLPDGGGCVLPGGRVLGVGESFFDGCNTCSCGAGGLLACTGRACPEDVVVPPPPVCVAPDGSRVDIGDSWRSADGCTECFCDMDSTLSCATRSDCFDAGPPPVCFAPDGTAIPPGTRALTRDFCQVCACPMPGAAALCVPSGDARCFDAGGPTVCRAPDGTAFAVGTTWTSRDRCTSCVCRRDGTTSCATNPTCVPDAAVGCVDPGGSPVPVGACFANGCLSCCCTAAGLQCMPSGAPGCIDAGVPPPVCNSVAPSPFSVPIRGVMGSPPTATGGTIPDGYYTLRDLVSYNGGSSGGTVRYAVQVTRGSMQFAVMAPGSPTVIRANFSFTTGGTLIRLTPTCSDGSMAGPGAGQYSVRPTGFDLFLDSGSAGQIQQMSFSR